MALGARWYGGAHQQMARVPRLIQSSKGREDEEEEEEEVEEVVSK